MVEVPEQFAIVGDKHYRYHSQVNFGSHMADDERYEYYSQANLEPRIAHNEHYGYYFQANLESYFGAGSNLAAYGEDIFQIRRLSFIVNSPLNSRFMFIFKSAPSINPSFILSSTLNLTLFYTPNFTPRLILRSGMSFALKLEPDAEVNPHNYNNYILYK